jgi:hypothetical protein
MSPHGRPKGDNPRLAGRRAAPGVPLMRPHGRPKGDKPRLAGLRGAHNLVFDERRAAPGVPT